MTQKLLRQVRWDGAGQVEVRLNGIREVRRAKVFKALSFRDTMAFSAVETTEHLDAPALEAPVGVVNAEIAVRIQRDPMSALTSGGELDQRVSHPVAISFQINGIHNLFRCMSAQVHVGPCRS
jgi:hypothetical protein